MSAAIIPLPRYGASPDSWTHFDLILGLTADLLPVVADPNAKIAPTSKLKGIGKTPSTLNRDRQVVGFANWTQHIATSSDITRWSREPSLGICLQTRRIRALDVDIEDGGTGTAILAMLPTLPRRERKGSNKFLVLFELPGEYTKRVLHTAHGAIEFLAQGQQAVIDSTHTAGERYTWAGGLPEEIPRLEPEQFEGLWQLLEERFAVEPSVERGTKAARHIEGLQADPVAQYLIKNGWAKGAPSREGRLDIRCPWQDEHSTDSGDSSTSYFPPHTGHYAYGAFVCQHAHCSNRKLGDLRSALGLDADDFDILTPDNEPPATEQDARFRVKSYAEFTSAPPPAWLIPGVLPRADLVVVFGESGTGKTFFALDMLGSLVRGAPWRGVPVEKCSAVYIAAEGRGGFRNRLRAYTHQNNLEALDVGVIDETPHFMKVDDVKAVIAAVKKYGPVDLIIVDTLAQVTSGSNENSGEDVGKALAHCRALQKATGGMVVLIHHAGKDTSKGARGWSGLRAAADAEIEISRNGNARTAKITKQKDGEDGAEYGFKLLTVPVGVDEADNIITSCVVEATISAPRSGFEPSGSKERLVWRVLNEMPGIDDEGVFVATLIDEAVDQTPHDANSTKRDRRREVAMVALKRLIAEGRAVLCEGGRVKPRGAA